LAERDVVESTLLGEPPAFPVKTLLQSPRGGVNRLEVIDWIRQRRPDIVVLFGASIISPSLLDLFPGRIVNVHLGLSPYYRGSAHAQRLAEGRVFRDAAFNAAAVRELSANIEGGMMSEYVRDAEARCRVYPIVPVPMEE